MTVRRCSFRNILKMRCLARTGHPSGLCREHRDVQSEDDQ